MELPKVIPSIEINPAPMKQYYFPPENVKYGTNVKVEITPANSTKITTKPDVYDPSVIKNIVQLSEPEMLNNYIKTGNTPIQLVFLQKTNDYFIATFKPCNYDPRQMLHLKCVIYMNNGAYLIDRNLSKKYCDEHGIKYNEIVVPITFDDVHISLRVFLVSLEYIKLIIEKFGMAL